MKYSSIETKIEYRSDIPDSVYRGIMELVGASSISNLSPEKKGCLKDILSGLFSGRGRVDYGEYAWAYAVYYLPVNLQKVWRPLLDLAIAGELRPKCKVLELGAGPGSATLGLVEFYKYLAYDNYSTEFSLEITVIEREQAFIDILHTLMERYLPSLPVNLKVSIETIRGNASLFSEGIGDARFDLIIESNMLNPNESFPMPELSAIAQQMRTALSRHSSLILIEPAKPGLTNHLKEMRSLLSSTGMTCFSPCSCGHRTCSQFASARLDISEIAICQELYDNGIISQPPQWHAFEYAVFRNDSLRKYDFGGDGVLLCNLHGHEGEVISFSAFILAVASPDQPELSLKVCDGSLPDDRHVWLNIPKGTLRERDINTLTCGRGSMVEVKNAVVLSENRIGVIRKTRIKIYR